MEMALSTKQRFLSCILFFLKLMNDESWFYLGNTLKSCNDSKWSLEAEFKEQKVFLPLWDYREINEILKSV